MPRSNEIGSNGSLATTFPSKLFKKIHVKRHTTFVLASHIIFWCRDRKISFLECLNFCGTIFVICKKSFLKIENNIIMVNAQPTPHENFYYYSRSFFGGGKNFIHQTKSLNHPINVNLPNFTAAPKVWRW